MSEVQALVSHAVKVALLVLLVGLVVRRRIRHCWSFGAYAVAVLVGNSLASLGPEVFYKPWFWVLKQGVYDILKMIVAMELAFRAFHSFPGGMRVARLVLVTVLLFSTVALGALTPQSSYMTLWEWQPGTAVASLWLLTATALLVVFFQVPVSDWQRAIMLGFAPYLLVFVAALEIVKIHGWVSARFAASMVDSVAYLALVLFWSWAVWRRPQSSPDGERV